ncbi:1-aminocyclopropane-1-carboxylate deaminase/D-cysteine desulfhydrase [Namhaeicola litoreus]|uniref:1-aminocyclopropane-1-carboxylate deaminase/D-cysteine desulfhydrase n=1 Tax=Namhaeicola litoreus TaxID=1052145 RepID=UPI00366F55A6
METTEIELDFTPNFDVSLFVKREDKIHPFISGNKFRKLKYNFFDAKEKGFKQLLTFGGAYSNHISAVASLGHEFGFKTIGVIRGDELGQNLQYTFDQNPTLKLASEQGMVFEFVSRPLYREKENETFINSLGKKFGEFYLIPEGGTNELAIKGCEEILTEKDEIFDYICVAVGTGGTIAGVINSSSIHQKVLGFPALKGDFLTEEIEKYTIRMGSWSLINDYHFGGYGKVNEDLINFINKFRFDKNIPLDPIYTGKMFYGIFELIKKGFFFKGAKILVVHTGGLQGIKGMNKQFERKKIPLKIYE